MRISGQILKLWQRHELFLHKSKYDYKVSNIVINLLPSYLLIFCNCLSTEFCINSRYFFLVGFKPNRSWNFQQFYRFFHRWRIVWYLSSWCNCISISLYLKGLIICCGYGSLNVILEITMPFSWGENLTWLGMLMILIDWIMGIDDHPQRKGWLMAGQK